MKLKLPFPKKAAVLAQPVATAVTRWDRSVSERPGSQSPAGLRYEVYDEMRRDSMIQTAMTLKTLGVLRASYRLESGGDTTVTHFVQRNLDQMQGSADSILQQAMDAFIYGWSVQELTYREHEGYLWLSSARALDPHYLGVVLDEFGRTTGLRLEIPGETPRDLPLDRYVVFRNRDRYGLAKGQSDLDAAHRHWKSKQELLTKWELHLAKFASPTVLGRFGTSVSLGEQGKLLDALRNITAASALVVPDEVEVTALQAAREASGYQEAVDFHNREIARCILGQTLTTDEGKRVGSLALGKVHLQIFEMQLVALRKALADEVMTEQVIRPLVELNFGPQAPIPRFIFEDSNWIA